MSAVEISRSNYLTRIINSKLLLLNISVDKEIKSNHSERTEQKMTRYGIFSANNKIWEIYALRTNESLHSVIILATQLKVVFFSFIICIYLELFTSINANTLTTALKTFSIFQRGSRAYLRGWYNLFLYILFHIHIIIIFYNIITRNIYITM